MPGTKGFDAHGQLWSTATDVALRLPWALLGLSDPSSAQALKVQPDGTISSVTIDQIGLTYAAGTNTVTAAIRWEPWQAAQSTDRPKDGLDRYAAAVLDVLTPA